jgi:CRP-like cAMP-binding protein
MSRAEEQHIAWLARSFGRPDYLPLTPSDLRVLASSAKIISRYARSHLFREGQQAEAAFLIQEGTVELYRREGSRRDVIARIGPGSVLGDIAMFSQGSHISSARAVTPVVAFQFQRDRLLPELARSPAICLRWLVASLTQLEKTQRRVIGLMHKTVLAQVASLLLDEADARGEVALSQTTIAMLLGASRQTVNEALGELRKQGAVSTGYRHVLIEDAESLRRAASSD